MLIIERYLIREILLTFAGVALLLILMFFSNTLIMILADVVEGDFPAKVIATLFALKASGNLVFILPLSLFLGVMLGLGRLYSDSEMSAMYACRVTPGRVLASIAKLAVVVAIVVAVLTLWFAPWAEGRSADMMDEVAASTEVEGIVAGRFNAGGRAGEVFYVEEIDHAAKRLTGLFAHSREGERSQVISAGRAYQRRDPESGERYLVLEDGYRFEGTPGQADFRIVAFERHGLRIPRREVVYGGRQRYAVPTATLWESTELRDIAELHWRFAVPISTLLLALLAVPLSRTNPRQGRYGKVFIGILVYVAYNNLLTVGRTALEAGQYPSWLGLWWVHALVLVVVVTLVRREQALHSPHRYLWRLLRREGRA